MEVTSLGMMKAFANIRSHLPIGAMYDCPALAKALGIRRALVKYDGSLPTGSFKVRGALNFASQQATGTKLFTHSSGNWAQGIAYAGRAFGLSVVVCMKPTASPLKRQRTIDFGAEVRELDGQPDQMTRLVKQMATESGGIFVSPYDHPLIIEGHASCGVEIHHACNGMGILASDVVLPVSGGGLAAGVAFAVKHHFGSGFKVTCVEPDGCDDFGQSLRSGTRTAIAAPRMSIADGMLANQVGESNWPVLQANVDEAVTVSDQYMVEAMRLLFTELGIITEPSGAITVAAALAGNFKPKGENAVFVVSGRNIETAEFLMMTGFTKKPAARKKSATKK